MMANVGFSAVDDEAILDSVLRAVAAGGARAPLTSEFDHPVAGLQPHWHLPGFGRKTRIRTSFGDLPIEALRLGDELVTADGGLARVVWLEKVCLDAEFLAAHPSARPILIGKNVFDHGKPLRDMLVSPRQEVALGMSGLRARFRSAGTIAGRPEVARLPLSGVTYFLFHCGAPVVAYAEGVPVRVAPLPEGALFQGHDLED